MVGGSKSFSIHFLLAEKVEKQVFPGEAQGVTFKLNGSSLPDFEKWVKPKFEKSLSL